MSSKEWKKVKLSEIAHLNYGKSLTSGIRKIGKVPVYSSSGITGWHDTALVNEDGIVIGRKGNVGSIFYADGPFYCIDTAYYIKKSELKCNIKYFYYLLKTLGLEKLNEDSAVPGLNRDTAHSQQFLYPEKIDAQNRIAEILSALDDKIELNRQTNATLEAIAQAIFKEWFVDFNFPGATGEMVESELGMIPKGWRVGKLGDVCKLIKGVSYKSSELQHSDSALVTLKSINRGGGFNNDGFKEYLGTFKTSQCLKEGDLIFAQTDITQNADVVGSPAIVENPFNYKNLVASLDIVKCEPTNEMPSSGTLYYFLQRQEFKDYCLSQTNGSTVLHLRSSEVPNYLMIIPYSSILREFNSTITPIRQIILENNQQNQILREIRDELLPKLMNGEIEV